MKFSAIFPKQYYDNTILQGEYPSFIAGMDSWAICLNFWTAQTSIEHFQVEVETSNLVNNHKINFPTCHSQPPGQGSKFTDLILPGSTFEPH